MTRRSPARRRPAIVDAAPRNGVVQPDIPASTSSGFAAMLESATQEMLAVTYWFDPDPHPAPYPVTVRFSGRRVDVKGRVQAGDRFVRDETIEKVVPGSGPISLTVKVHGINAGEWVVTAHMQGSAPPTRGARKQEEISTAAVSPAGPVTRFWRRWAPSVGSDDHVRTCLTPFAHVPGIVLGIWGAMVTLGMAVALALQFLVIVADHLAVGPWWVISLVSTAVGIVGAKGWYIILYQREHRVNGWCIQGFVICAILMAAILLVALKVSAGVFLDVTAPGLLVAMAIGRVGCFFAGCCGGPPTTARWGVWSSDQRVGARRIPTQLLEFVLALSLGLGALGAVLSHGPAGGAFFVAALAAYTLGRQGILLLRAEARKTRLGVPVTATLAALVLITVVVLLVQ